MNENQLFNEKHSVEDETRINREGRFLSSIAEDNDEFRTPLKRRNIGFTDSIWLESFLDGGRVL